MARRVFVRAGTGSVRGFAPRSGGLARWVSGALTLALTANLVWAGPALAEPGGSELPAHAGEFIETTVEKVRPRTADPEEKVALRGARAASWPAAAGGEADLAAAPAKAPGGRVRVAGTPVSVGAPRQRDAQLSDAVGDPARVKVEVADRAAAAGAGIDGLLLRLHRQDAGRSTGKVSVQVDYSTFGAAIAGDGPSRLKLYTVPDCVQTTPAAPQCQAKPLPTTNDLKTQTLTADAPVSSAAPTQLAVMAAGTGSSGSATATPLSAASTWGQGGSTGDFSWSYPIRVPPSLGGPAPEISLAYSSGSIDGRMVSSNNQPSWAGSGFDYSPGLIERKYVPCASDTKVQAGQTPNNASNPTGDQCWRTDNATMSLNGKGSELVPVDAQGNVWRMRNDDGTIVKRLFNTARNNGDEDGEYWVAITPDGTQYHFGYHKLPAFAGSNVTNSVFTVPVYANHPGDTGYNSVFADSDHVQGWRWNLDYVVDLHGNTMSYYYGKETNLYARAMNPNDAASYVRGGWLDRIEYGQRSGATGATSAIGKVLFATAERCLPATSCDITNKTHWSDTPVDQRCAAAPCNNKFSPTFWTTKKLTTIKTQVSNGSGGFRDVDSWALRHSFPDPGDGTPAALWLEGITHTGHVGTPAKALPEVTFTGQWFNNRVDSAASDYVGPMNWRRITAVHGENGGKLAVTFEATDCYAPGGLPAEATNTKRCMPVKWTPEGLSERVDWFHKYVLKSVTQSDELAGTVPMETSYQYLGGAAWKYDEPDGLTPAENKTWSQWRGYNQVRTTIGNATDGRQVSDAYYFRGMDGNRTSGGGTQTVYVKDSQGVSTTVKDSDRVAGTVREKISWLAVDVTMLTRETTDPWISPATATSVKSWGTTTATLTDTKKVSTRTATVNANGTAGWRDGTLVKTIENDGRTAAISSRPDVADPKFDECTRYWHVSNSTANLIHLPWRVQQLAAACDLPITTVTEAMVVQDTRMFYDGNTVAYDQAGFTAPTRGLASRTEVRDGWSGGDSTFKKTQEAFYDPYGRVDYSKDAKNGITDTTYVPDTGGPVTSVKTKNPAGHESTVHLEPAFGAQLAMVDANDKRTDIELDPLGRVVKVWSPGRVKGTDAPDAEFGYVVRTDGPEVITTKRLLPAGGFATSYELYDGLARMRQTQVPGAVSGRVMSDMSYDSRGNLVNRNGPYADSSAPTSDIATPLAGTQYSTVKTAYDLAGRPVTESLWIGGAFKWSTTSTYRGTNRIDVQPPAGGVVSSTVNDARGNTISLRQYKAPGDLGSNDPTKFTQTTYTYDNAGRQKTVVDDDNNTWTNEYDNLGRLKSSQDPDRGTTKLTYNVHDEVETTEDARGEKLAYTYDILGRRTSVRDDTIDGTVRAEWKFDTLPHGKGLPVSSTRRIGSDDYISRVVGYDAVTGRPTGTEVVIPSVAGNPAGTYRYDVTYNVDGSVATTKMPAGGGLSEETMSVGYNAMGLANTLTGTVAGVATQYVPQTTYSAFAEPIQFYANLNNKYVRYDNYYETGTRRLLRSTALTQTLGTTKPISDLNYTYDATGNITSIADKPYGLTVDTQCFDYDYLRRLEAAWTTGTTCGASESVTLSGLGTGPAPYWHTWKFDDTGNRTEQVIHGTTDEKTTYVPNPGQPHTLNYATRVKGSSTVTLDYQFDVAGNTTHRPNPANTAQQVLTWDAEGHLTQVNDNGALSKYIYDADGNRLLKTEGSTTTLYLPGQEITKNGTTLTGRRYYSHAGQNIGVRDTASGKVTWMVADHHGTNGVAIDSATAQTVTRRYSDPYGGNRSPGAPPTWADDKGFVGGVKDTTGLTHLGAREYDPTLGRFLSIDPVIDVADPQQMHGYAYSNNNPITYTDPSGLRFLEGENPGDIICHSTYEQCAANSAKDRLESEKRKIEKAKAVKKKSIKDILIEEGLAFLLDMLGVTDIVDCFTKGDIGACIGMVMNVLPGTKLIKMGKSIIKAIDRGFTAYRGWQKAVRVADDIISRGDDLLKAAQAKLDEAMDALASKTKKSGCHSFDPDTRVLMADGTTKRIEDVEVGDEVMATDPEAGVTTPKPVVALHNNNDWDLADVSVIDSETGATTVLHTTWFHPFWIESSDSWVDAADLRPGDRLRNADGESTQIVAAVKIWTGLKWMRDLTVEDIHTYYVISGGKPVLVHNTDAEACPLFAGSARTRPDDLIEDADGYVDPPTPEELAAFNVRGKSTFDNVDALRAHVTPGQRVRQFTNLPDGVGMIRDGGKAPGVPEGHITLYPTKRMKRTEFDELLLGVEDNKPWQNTNQRT